MINATAQRRTVMSECLYLAHLQYTTEPLAGAAIAVLLQLAISSSCACAAGAEADDCEEEEEVGVMHDVTDWSNARGPTSHPSCHEDMDKAEAFSERRSLGALPEGAATGFSNASVLHQQQQRNAEQKEAVERGRAANPFVKARLKVNSSPLM